MKDIVSHDQAVEYEAVERRLVLSASLTQAKRQGGRVSLSDLISARKAEKSAKRQARTSARKQREEMEEVERANAAFLTDDLKRVIR